MPHHKKWQCQRVVQIDKMIQVFFKCIEREQEELMILNIIAKPDKYEVGTFYYWPDGTVFPH